MSVLKVQNRIRRHQRVRSKISGTAEKPRLAIFRSNSAIYAQLIDDVKGVVLAVSSSLKGKKTKGIEAAKQVGADIGKLAKDKNITKCVFDRGGYLYHGRVKALAEGARESGLQF